MAKTPNILKLKGDKAIWIVAVLLALISMLAVYTAISAYAGREYGNNTGLALAHHMFTLITALVIMFVAYLIPSKIYCNLSTFMLVLTIPLLILTLTKGKEVNDATRALEISLGSKSITFQTSEFAKVFLLNYIAAHLYFLKEKIQNIKVVIGWFFVPIAIVVGLVMPPNMSMALMIFLDCIVLLFVGGVQIKHLLGFAGICIVLGGLYIGYKLTLPAEQQGRVGTWKARIERHTKGNSIEEKSVADSLIANEPKYDPFDSHNFQQTCSKIAIASGGLLGKGSGHSQQRNFLPHPYSDFIFAIIIEEYGLLLGGCSILILYIILMTRGFRTLKTHKDTYGGFLVFGLAFMIVVQAFINMGVAVTLLPVTGQPLPFVSMGGSALWAIGLAFGMMLSATRNLDKHNEKKENTENNDSTLPKQEEYIVQENDGETVIVVTDEE